MIPNPTAAAMTIRRRRRDRSTTIKVSEDSKEVSRFIIPAGLIMDGIG